MQLERLVDFYETLTLYSVPRLAHLYAADACFKDPFNEVRGADAIQRIFVHMFTQVEAPRFKVTERLLDGSGAMLAWEFHFLPRAWGKRKPQVIRGVSHFKFNNDGKVSLHRDYWDAAEELYAKLPVVGHLMRYLQQALRTKI